MYIHVSDPGLEWDGQVVFRSMLRLSERRAKYGFVILLFLLRLIPFVWGLEREVTNCLSE